MSNTNKIKLSTLPLAGSDTPKRTIDVAAANSMDAEDALVELKARSGKGGDIKRVGQTRATGWTRA
jgi:hypothetical protein